MISCGSAKREELAAGNLTLIFLITKDQRKCSFSSTYLKPGRWLPSLCVPGKLDEDLISSFPWRSAFVKEILDESPWLSFCWEENGRKEN